MSASDIKTFVSLLRVLNDAGALRHPANVGIYGKATVEPILPEEPENGDDGYSL